MPTARASTSSWPQALAEALGVKLSPLPFPADENMDDDLRNMVWRGHYLGYGPADVLLHVPVDRPLMQANPQVSIFAPYWRERVVMARNLEQLPVLESLAQLAGQPVAVPGQSLAGWLLIGAEGGALPRAAAHEVEGRRRGRAGAAARRGAGGRRAVRRSCRRCCAATRASPSSRCRRRARRAMAGPWAWRSRRTPPSWRRRCRRPSTSWPRSGRLAEIFASANLAWRPV